jgi:hypothetical protein
MSTPSAPRVVRLRAPKGTIGGLTISGRFYEVDDQGFVTVRGMHEAAAIQQGCLRAGGDMPSAPTPANAKDAETA